MISTKILIAVLAVTVAIVYAQEKWSTKYENQIHEISKQMKESGTNSELTAQAKKSMTNFHEHFKSDLTAYYDKLAKNPEASNDLKISVGQWKKKVDEYVINFPDTMTDEVVAGKFVDILNYIIHQSEEVFPKAQGKSAPEEETKAFIGSILDKLVDCYKSLQTTVKA
ncbi:uncharacterized protein LOC126904994 [Daktulosphaira vitifoliae]|uniref:uncharacterized protein LOC126904994 n=1 Tax=Daktulosphaira vitifoliae TaxID=58002 RepID=UPI0021A9787A|nr:uncharacterized protein LOC126904994 [Daktulosphaira vitifoliae]